MIRQGSRLWVWVIAAFALFFIASNPTSAALLARHLGSGLSHLASSLGAFVSGLGGGR